MKQTFEIESFDGLTQLELLGILEDSVSKESWAVKELKKDGINGKI